MYFRIESSPEFDELLQFYPNELRLLLLIARRARLKDGLNLKAGEAWVGDSSACGLSRQQYRTSLKKLEDWGQVTTKSTTKGTIVTLTEESMIIWSSGQYEKKRNQQNNQQNNHQATIKQPSSNHQATIKQPLTNRNREEGIDTKLKLSIEHRKEIRKKPFSKKVMAYSKKGYSKSMLEDFIGYWTESGEHDIKMRFEKQQSWGMSRRLSTWNTKQVKYKKTNATEQPKVEHDTSNAKADLKLEGY